MTSRKYAEVEGLIWDVTLNTPANTDYAQLRSVDAFAGTLLHELTHARTGHIDVSRDFEAALTEVIGALALHALTPKERSDTARTTVWERWRKWRERKAQE